MTPEQFDAVLDDIRAGMPTHKALKKHGNYTDSFYMVLSKSPEAEERYARAKLKGMEYWADEIVELSDESRVGKKTVTENGKVTITSADMVERTKLQIDSRKWLLSKLIPKKYGEHLHLEHSGTIDNAATIEAARKRALAAINDRSALLSPPPESEEKS